jgi:hypothetical protein
MGHPADASVDETGNRRIVAQKPFIRAVNEKERSSMTTYHRGERSGPRNELTGCIITRENPSGSVTVERRNAREGWTGVSHGRVTSSVTYGPKRKA